MKTVRIIGFPQIFCGECGARASNASGEIEPGGAVTLKFAHWEGCIAPAEMVFPLPTDWVIAVDIEG